MRLVFAIVTVLGLIGLGAPLGAQEITQPQPTLPQNPLVIQTSKGRVNLTVEMATTPQQQQIGLMFRKTLAPNAGMLFDFGVERPQAFWMKNTLIPLDMLFIKGDGTIVRIAAMTKPLSEDTVPSYEPVRVVLELAGGRAAALGIQPGDKAIHRIFGNAR
jgi:uncharacterized membrane protein (UPF0127 family)